jgi:thiosulfate/3-mercaptopyruvate sulfurtransferase
VEAGEDHLEPEDLADLMMRGDEGIVVVDVRPEEEYRAFHLRGAVNIPVPELPAALEPHRKARKIVLYSNGMTHPAQARDSLQRLGFGNVFILTDGLDGFISACLRPVSLRAELLSPEQAHRVRSWRSHFLGTIAPAEPKASGAGPEKPGLVTASWLSERLGRPDLKVIDLRPNPEYNTGHIPGALGLNVESLRGNVKGVPSMLLPADLLARQFSLMGLRPEDTAVLVYGDKPHDATLAGMGLERLGHRRWGILDGGYPGWIAEKHPVSQALPVVVPSSYPVPPGPDGFTVDSAFVLERHKRTPILDARPAEFFSGAKSDEARAGHIPGAVNRPYTADVVKEGSVLSFMPQAALEAEYAKLLPGKDTPVIVHCRTGHQASQAYFILKHLLGYRDVLWYDAGWSEWATRAELPVTR